MGPAGGYRLAAGSDLPPLLFDDEQAVALAVALQTVVVAGAGVEEAALRALTTVRQVLPTRLRSRLDAIRFTSIPARPEAGATAVSPAVLVLLSAAVRSHEVLRFDYAPPGSDAATAPPRRVEPHAVVASQGRWYLVAWDLERDDWRIFRADRMTPRTPTGPRFAPRGIPGGDVAGFVSARFSGSDRPGSWPCIGKVVLNRPIADVLPFAGDGIVQELDGQRCSLEAGAWSWIGLAASLNRFDTDVEVLRPPELRAAFAELAARNAATAAPLSG
ncbi:hypothetical protein GCM10025866_31400 [Naasia aerilata]|uniref:WYL domain-containing protein n=2 Tax=Naasia aerilata TaxID=1162966 RepID=A0ABM8GFV6_9MICO|nr:hypothetical protein GCM10025866_31400 [Naasia aerilata]